MSVDNISDYKDFWEDIANRVRAFSTLDDANLVFGANSNGGGHHYEILPTLTDEELKAIESTKGVVLPIPFASFLRYFGAGGAGPGFGVQDVRATIKETDLSTSFRYDEKSLITGDVCDNPIIENFDGLMYLGTAGSGTDHYIELNGDNVGKVWVQWGEGGSNSIADFSLFYSEWVDRVEISLTRYHCLKRFAERTKGFMNKFNRLSFKELKSALGCGYREYPSNDSGFGAPAGHSWIYFDSTPGKVVINDRQEVVDIDFSDRCAI